MLIYKSYHVNINYYYLYQGSIMIKHLEHKKAILLRKKGLSIKKIAIKLRISSSTANIWLKNVKLTREQKERLYKNAHDPFFGKRKQHVLNQIKKKEREINKEKKLGIKDIGKLTARELFISGVGLYWAEGFKKDRRLGFANSDPSMIKLFIKWLTGYCNVPKDQIRLRVCLNISHNHRIKEVEKYWSELTEIPLNHFQKPFFQKFKWKKKYPNENNYFGVLRIRANKQLKLFRRISGWIEGLKLNGSDPPLPPL